MKNTSNSDQTCILTIMALFHGANFYGLPPRDRAIVKALELAGYVLNTKEHSGKVIATNSAE